MKTSCKIIEDLLPLYHDKICSEESSSMVEDHLKECAQCKKLLEDLDQDASVVKPENVKLLKGVREQWIKIRKRSLVRGLIAGICICLVLWVGYLGLTQWYIVDVPTGKMIVTDLCQLSSGDIAFHLYIDDKYDLNRIDVDTKDGVMYITPQRAVLQSKRIMEYNQGLYNRDYVVCPSGEFTDYCDFSYILGEELTAVYLGTPGDSILIWKQGQELPAATAELEERYRDYATR